MTRQSASVTIRDVARKAGVSVATVSRYLNKNTHVSEILSNRIQEVMDELDYVPQATARHLAMRKKNTIGLLLTNMHNDFFAPLLTGIEEVVSEQGYNLLVATCHPQTSSSDYQLPLGRHNTDGLLAFADSLTDQQISIIYNRQLPIVLLHKSPTEGLNIPFVTIENKTATQRLITHLITVHNCRNIILMRGPTQQDDANLREIGYKDALISNGIPYNEDLSLLGSFERQTAYQSMKSFLENPDHPEFDAVFAGDDEAAIGVYASLKEAGLRIPEDIKVVGFDDSHISPFLTPPLTTVHSPIEEVGRTATRHLFCLLAGNMPETATIHPTEIIYRESCGCHSGSVV